MRRESLCELLNHKVVFGVSDPWDFVTENGEGTVIAYVIATQEKALALKLDKPLSFKGTDFDHVVATARHEGKELTKLNQSAIPVNLTPIPSEISRTQQPDALFTAAKDWRGWHLVGGLRIDS